MSLQELVTFSDAPFEIIDGDRGKNYPSRSEFTETGHCLFLSATNVTKAGFAFSECQFIDPARDAALNKGKLQRNDIVLTTRGTVGNAAYYNDAVPFNHLRINSGMVILRCEQSKLLPAYLYHFVRSPNFFSQVNGLRSGVAQPQLPIRDMRRIKLPLPPLPTQRKIAGILSAYDDLIENNLRRIKILEQMAQSLYREWFVHFRFPGHESATFKDSELGRIPERWEVRRILDFADVIYGFSFKANRFNSAGEGIPVVRIRNIQDGQSETYTEEEGDPKHRIRNGDILVGMDGDFHMTIWSGGDSWQNQRVAKFRPKGAMGNYLLFLALERPIHFFDSTITGTTVAHLGDSHIKTIEFAAPPESLMRKASDLLEPMAQEQLNLRRRNQTLRRTRDLLLPKLLSNR